VEIAYNAFQNCSGDRLLDFRMSGGALGSAKRPWVHHNYFFQNANGNNVAFGTSRAHTGYAVDSIIEYNLFRNIDGLGVYMKSSNHIVPCVFA
jgi:hypothetical protein